MKSVKIYTCLALCVFLISGCKKPPNKYVIKLDGVFSNNQIITGFSISQFKLDHQNWHDIRPKNDTELMRYCCDLISNKTGDFKVLFNANNYEYQWRLCKLDTSIIANDSLNGLSLDSKLNYLNKRDSLRKKTGYEIYQLPFSIQSGYVYQLFGLPDLEGSYYFCLNSTNQLLVQFVDNGPL